MITGKSQDFYAWFAQSMILNLYSPIESIKVGIQNTGYLNHYFLAEHIIDEYGTVANYLFLRLVSQYCPHLRSVSYGNVGSNALIWLCNSPNMFKRRCCYYQCHFQGPHFQAHYCRDHCLGRGRYRQYTPLQRIPKKLPETPDRIHCY